MKTSALATLLLAVVGVFGLMGGTSSAKAKVIDTTGAIDVRRSTALFITPLTMDTARYTGGVTVFTPEIRLNAAREIKRRPNRRKRRKPGAAAAGGKKRKTILKIPSEAQEAEARLQADGLCRAFTRLTLLEVFHLSTPPFLLGRVFPDPGIRFSFDSDRPPSGDPVRSQQVGTDFGGAPVATAGIFKWTVSCSAVQADARAP